MHHMLSAGMEAKVRETVVRFAWYVEESKGEGMERCELLESAARLLSVGHVRREPLDVAGQIQCFSADGV